MLLIVGIIPTFSKEKKNAMEIIQITSAYGRKLNIPIKLIAHIFVAVWLELLFGIINYVVIHMQYGLSGTKMMLYSINEYRYTPLNISVIEFYLLEVLSKCIGFAIIAVILTMIARLIKNTYAAFIAMIGYTSVFLYFRITLVENVLTLISPFSLLKLGELATSLKEIKFCGHFMTFHSFLYGVQATLIVILLCTMLVIEKRGK